jgi:peptide-methionine (S)-S-oxide reductase
MKIATLLALTLGMIVSLETALAGQPAFDPRSVAPDHEIAVFAGGCFWCMEPPYDALYGVIETISGYTGGTLPNPTYRQVVQGGTGHFEAVLVVYDPARVTYEELLEVFWYNIDPLDAGGQFCDRGDMYRSGIFVHNADQEAAAKASRDALTRSRRLPRTIVTEIMSLRTFYVAEEYHQNYYRKNPLQYRFYRIGCGRDARLQQLWGADAP